MYDSHRMSITPRFFMVHDPKNLEFTLITNFEKERYPIYEEALRLFKEHNPEAADNLIIEKAQYLNRGLFSTTSDYYSLHRKDPHKQTDLSEFWNIVSTISKRVEI